MKNKVKIWSVLLFATVFVASMCFTSCGKDDEDDGSKGLVGWYLCNDTLLTKDNWPRFSMGIGDEEMWGYGYCPLTIHIVDDLHLDFYQSAGLYDEGDSRPEGMDKIYQIDGGKMAAYGTPQHLTYNRRTDGGIDFSLSGSQIILAKTATGFEVTSGYWQNCKIFIKYDPNKAY